MLAGLLLSFCMVCVDRWMGWWSEESRKRIEGSGPRPCDGAALRAVLVSMWHGWHHGRKPGRQAGKAYRRRRSSASFIVLRSSARATPHHRRECAVGHPHAHPDRSPAATTRPTPRPQHHHPQRWRRVRPMSVPFECPPIQSPSKHHNNARALLDRILSHTSIQPHPLYSIELSHTNIHRSHPTRIHPNRPSRAEPNRLPVVGRLGAFKTRRAVHRVAHCGQQRAK